MANEQKNTKKYTNKPLVILVIVAIVAVGTMFWLTHRGTNEKKIKTTTASTSSQVQAEDDKSLIDFDKTENVEIVNGEKQNTSAQLAKEKTFQGMTVKNIELKTESGLTHFTATVENNSGSNYAGGKLTIVFTNQDGSEFAKLNSILPAIENGKTNTIDAQTTADIANAYDFSIQ